MTVLEQQLHDALSLTVANHNMLIDELHYKKQGKEFILQIYVEREDLSPIDLDDIVSLSEDLSLKLDEIDLIQDEYCLDVSTSGADKPIKDFSKFPLLVGKYMEIHLVNGIKGQNIFRATLDEVDGNILRLSYMDKTRLVKLEVEIENIYKARLTVKL